LCRKTGISKTPFFFLKTSPVLAGILSFFFLPTPPFYADDRFSLRNASYSGLIVPGRFWAPPPPLNPSPFLMKTDCPFPFSPPFSSRRNKFSRASLRRELAILLFPLSPSATPPFVLRKGPPLLPFFTTAGRHVGASFRTLLNLTLRETEPSFPRSHRDSFLLFFFFLNIDLVCLKIGPMTSSQNLIFL